MTRRAAIAGAIALLGAIAALTPAAAQTSPQTSPQTWPQRPVRFIVSLGPGSGADIGARLIADRLTAKWKQPVVVENRPGGDAVLAINAFIGARDDHTLLYTPTASLTAHPFQMAKLPYDPAELAPVARLSITLVGWVIPASMKVGTVKEFVDLIRALPGKLNFTTAVGMTDVIFDSYFKNAGLAITRVPYRDVVAPLSDLGEGRIHTYVGALAITQPHIEAKRVRLIAVTNSERAPTQPKIPTVAQAGFPDLTFDGLIGLFGQRDMSADLRRRIAADLRQVIAEPEVTARLTGSGQAVSPGTPEDLRASMDKQRAVLAAFVQQLGLKPK
ncbi:MAG: tripartite tricarboxylate transporter substrate binding protein [Hyphomicrobiales bacterium]|nr:tripartite tricarboxylate transporter substrate binding protein [Hyphomicrobiales bacterium]